MKAFKSFFANKQLLVLIGVAVLGVALFVTSSILSQRAKVTQQASRAAVGNLCELAINIVRPTTSITPKAITPTRGQSPTPTPPCKNCNYQVDLFWGPVINSFANKPNGKTGNRYSAPVKRLISSRHDTPSAGATSPNPTCSLVPPPAYSDIALPTLSPDCTQPVERGLLTGSIDIRYITPPNGYAVAGVKNTSSTCTFTVGLASYKANYLLPETQWIPTQNLYDSQTRSIGPNQQVALLVKMPMLNDQPVCHRIPVNPTVIVNPSIVPKLTTTPTPKPIVCSQLCSTNADCQAGYICSPSSVSAAGARVALTRAANTIELNTLATDQEIHILPGEWRVINGTTLKATYTIISKVATSVNVYLAKINAPEPRLDPQVSVFKKTLPVAANQVAKIEITAPGCGRYQVDFGSPITGPGLPYNTNPNTDYFWGDNTLKFTCTGCCVKSVIAPIKPPLTQ